MADIPMNRDRRSPPLRARRLAYGDGPPYTGRDCLPFDKLRTSCSRLPVGEFFQEIG